MTAEVVVMNRGGVALAADSAVTIQVGDSSRVRDSALKLFRLSKYRPVGVMIYENASLLGVPWETIIKIFREEFEQKEHPKLVDYGIGLIKFLDGNDSLFPEEVQDKYYLVALEAEYRRIESRARDKLVDTRLYNIGNPQAQREPEQKTDTEFVEREIATAAKLWARKEEASYFMAEKIEEETPEEETARRKTAREIAGRNSGDVARLIEQVFVIWEIGIEYWRMLLRIAEDLVAKDKLSDELFSGLVIAGFGESEHFPTVQHIEIGGVYGGKLKARPPQVHSVSEQNPSQVMSFAYTEMVESFLDGISPDALNHLDNAAEFIRKMPTVVTKTALDLPSEKKAEIARIVRQTSEDQGRGVFEGCIEGRVRQTGRGTESSRDANDPGVSSGCFDLGQFKFIPAADVARPTDGWRAGRRRGNLEGRRICLDRPETLFPPRFE